MIKDFWCKDLKPYVDSMLFDSGDQIAFMDYEEDGWHIKMELVTSGDVNVDYKGSTYRYPSDFPDDLKELIKNNRWWDTEDLWVDMNNWFEYVYNIISAPSNHWIGIDGVVCEEDISKETEDDIKNGMLEIIGWIKGGN